MIQIRIDVFPIIYLGYIMLYGPFWKWPPLKNDENNKRSIYGLCGLLLKLNYYGCVIDLFKGIFSMNLLDYPRIIPVDYDYWVVPPGGGGGTINKI